MKSPLLLTISKDTLIGQTAAFLYAIKRLPESVEIKDIDYKFNSKDVELTIHIKEEEVDTIYF